VVTLVIPDSDALANVTPNGVSGRNCVGVTGERVTLAPLNETAARATNGQAGPFACHPFTLVKQLQEKQCSKALSKKGDRCVCPDGQTFSQGRGRCVGDVAEPQEPQEPDQPTDVEQPRLCKLLPGYDPHH
jgi:hypothetical protein